MRYWAGFTQAFNQKPFAVLTAESPFPAFTAGAFVALSNQPPLEVRAVLYRFSKDAQGFDWCLALVVATPPVQRVTDDDNPVPWPW